MDDFSYMRRWYRVAHPHIRERNATDADSNMAFGIASSQEKSARWASGHWTRSISVMCDRMNKSAWEGMESTVRRTDGRSITISAAVIPDVIQGLPGLVLAAAHRLISCSTAHIRPNESAREDMESADQCSASAQRPPHPPPDSSAAG